MATMDPRAQEGWSSAWLAVPGSRLHMRTRGTGPTLVLIHGTGTDSSTWEPVVEALASRHHLVVYDRRSYGMSEGKPVRDYRVHIRDLAALLDHVGPAHVFGWSSGGNTAIGAALAVPHLFRSLTVLEAPFHGTRRPNGMYRTLVAVKMRQFQGRPDEAAATFLRWASRLTDGSNAFDAAPPETQQHLTGYSRQILAELDPHPFGVMADFIPTRHLARLANIPTTWLLGDNSVPWFDRLRARVVARVPHIRTVRILSAGHLAHHENPTAFVAAVLQATGEVQPGEFLPRSGS